MASPFKTIGVLITANAGQLRTELAKAATSVKGFQSSVDSVTAAATSTDAKTQKAFANIAKGSMVVGAGLTAGFAIAARASMGFDRQMSEVAAASDATGATLERLRDAALDAGAATAFSASEAATAQTELLKAGISTADVLGGALRGSLDLAAAGTLDLGRAAEISAAAMTVFKLSGRDVGRIADIFAAGANKSAADVEGLAQALDQSGLVAAQFGLTLEDTVGVLAQMAQAGLKGSDAGTSLKTALQRMVPQSVEARETMAALGIEMFDASGRFIGLEGAAEQLKRGLGRLSQEQRAQALQTIFGQDAIRAATILYEGGGRAAAEWRRNVDDAGAASETAAKKLDNLSGDLEALGGSIETALIRSGSSANGVLRFMAQQATGVVNAVSSLPGPVQATGTAIAGIAGPTLLAAGAVGSLVPKIQTARTSLEGLGAAGNLASRSLGFLGRASAVGVGLGTLAIGVELLTDQLLRLQHGPAPSLSEMANSLVKFGESGKVSGALAREFGADLGKLTDKLKDLDGGVGSGGILGNIFSPNSRSRLKDAKRDVDALDKSLAELVRGGHADEARARFADLAESLAGSGFSGADLRRRLDDYRAALAEVDTEQRLAEGSADDLTTKVGEQTAAFGDAAEAAKKQADALDAVLQASLAQFDSTIAYERSLDGLEDANQRAAEAQQAHNDAVKAHGPRSKEAEDAAEKQRRAHLDTKGSYLDVARAAARQAEDQAAAAGRVLPEADKYRVFRDKLIELKDTLAPGSALRVALEEMINKIGEIPAEKTVTVTADTAQATAALDTLRAQFDRLATDVNAQGPSLFGPVGAAPSPTVSRRPALYRHAGGIVPGRGGTDVPAVLQSGEYVLRAAAVKAIGVGTLEGLNRYHEGGHVGRPMPSVPVGPDNGALVRELQAMRAALATMPRGSIDARQHVEIKGGGRPSRADLEYANRQHQWALAGAVTR